MEAFLISMKCKPSGRKPEKAFNKAGASNTDKTVAENVSKNVSLKNCITSWPLELPIVLRIPISLDRFEACAVVKLIKLIQPSNSNIAATASRL